MKIAETKLQLKGFVHKQRVVITRPRRDRAPFRNSFAAMLAKRQVTTSWDLPGPPPLYQPTLVTRHSTDLSAGYPEIGSRAMSSVR